MSLFYISVFNKNAPENANPIWQNSLDANDVEAAYAIGKDQFQIENPDKNMADFTIKASGYSADK